MPRRPDDIDRPALQALSTPSLREHLIAVHHDYLWARLPFLVPMAAKLTRQPCGAGTTCPDLAEIVAELRTLVLDHLDREEQVLVAACGEPITEGVLARIAALHQEHLALERLLERVQVSSGLAARLPPEACPTQRAFYSELDQICVHVRSQIKIEGEILAPRLAAAAAG
jgi:iron-sulfur cluster repair protein YtfE (RIC family)